MRKIFGIALGAVVAAGLMTATVFADENIINTNENNMNTTISAENTSTDGISTLENESGKTTSGSSQNVYSAKDLAMILAMENAADTEAKNASDAEMMNVESQAKTAITDVDMYITEPANGDSLSREVTIFSNPENAADLDKNYSATRYGGLNWSRVSKDVYTKGYTGQWERVEAGDVASSDYVYSVGITINPKDGYKFLDATTVSINGEKYTGAYVDEKTAYVSLIFENVSSENNVITSVRANITEPAIGETPDMNPTYTSDLGAEAVNVPYNGVIWYKLPESAYTGHETDASLEWQNVGENEKFEAGYAYAAEVNIYPTDSHYSLSEGVTGIINNKEAEVVYGPIYEKDYATLRITFGILKGEKADGTGTSVTPSVSPTGTDGTGSNTSTTESTVINPTIDESVNAANGTTIDASAGTENGTTSGTTSNAPKTGDENNINLWVAIVSAGIGAAVATLVMMVKGGKMGRKGYRRIKK